MKAFKDTVVVKYPPEALWLVVRDRLSELATIMDDVERITVVERDEPSPGRVRLVNEWRSSHRIPAFLHATLGAASVSWLDRNEWDDDTRCCTWGIEPSVLTEHIHCAGATTYEPAMAGRGTRVTFAGTFELAPGALRDLAGPLQNQAASFVESMVTVIVPRNLRKMMEAGGQLIAAGD